MHFLLIHGAWHGAWCYAELIDALQALGADATAIDLPGHGDEPTPLDAVSMDAYVERAQFAVRELDRRVEVVGHSMGGAIITQLAARNPQYVQGLTYLCAFLPEQGEKLADMGVEDTASQLNAALRPGVEAGSLVVDAQGARDVFYHDVDPARAEAAVARLCPQATAPLASPIHYDASAFDSVPRTYIVCDQDRAITATQQQRMIDRVGADPVLHMDTGHSPFLADPGGLAQMLLNVAEGRAPG